MADSKISALSAITAIAGTDELVVASSGASKKITAANLAATLGIGIVQVSKVSLTTGDLTTTSTTFTDATGLTTTITTGAHRCIVVFTCNAHVSASGINAAFDLAVDGTRQGQTYGLSIVQQAGGAAGPNVPVVIFFLTSALTAASHTFKIQWRVDGSATGTLFASTGVSPAILNVLELGF